MRGGGDGPVERGEPVLAADDARVGDGDGLGHDEPAGHPAAAALARHNDAGQAEELAVGAPVRAPTGLAQLSALEKAGPEFPDGYRPAGCNRGAAPGNDSSYHP